MKIIAIFLLTVLAFTTVASVSAYPDSPKAQMEKGTPADKVICRDNLQLLIRNNGNAICATESTAMTLEERGLAVMVNNVKYMSHDEKYASEQQAVMNMVNDAITLYDEQGQDAFTAITSMAADHNPENPYVFVVNSDDQRLVAHGFKPDQVGEISISLTSGTKSIEQLDSDGMWTEYIYENPVTGLDTHKRSWLVSHDGYIFGSGYFISEYDAKMIMINNTIQDSITLFDEYGMDSFEMISNMQAYYETYPFVLDMDGLTVASGSDPSYVNTVNINSLNLNKSWEDVINELNSEGKSWVKYEFVNPETNNTEPKKSQLVLYNEYIFGSGYHISDDKMMSDTEMSDDSMMSDTEMSDEMVSDETMSDTEMSDDSMMSDTEMSDEMVSDDSMSDTEMSDEMMSDIEVSDVMIGDVSISEPTSSLVGDIIIGSMAPITGGATVYGQEISMASQLAVIHFNDYLQENNESWSLSTQRHDGGTSSDMALTELGMLNESGIKIIDGPALDYSPDVLNYANDNDMLLVSCCSATTLLAQDDAMFRIAPGHTGYAEKLAQIINDDGIDTIIPIGVENMWTDDILDMTATMFTDLSEENTTIQRITYTDDLTTAVSDLVDAVEVLESNENVAIVYGGFEENVEFFNLSSQHESLLDIRWYGTDLNTVHPNVVNDSTALEFAKNVQLTSIQPHVTDNEITQQITSHFESEEFVRAPSVYTSYEYDVVWLIGLAILDSQSTDVDKVKESLTNVVQEYSGASDSIELDEMGDRSNGQYISWKIIDDVWVESN